jgi:outer membrane protein assembly factor BamB
MDEVPVANANPVNVIVAKTDKKPEKPKKNPIMVSLKNLFHMAPLALIVLIQLFFLGKSFGTFSTFPFTSFTTFILIAALAVLLFFLQMLQRSIVYSTLGGVALVCGIFYAWFGDFHQPILENLKSIGTIVKAAWTRKDIPFNLLMSGAMTFTIAGVAFLQFFVSLFIKSFFETFFEKDWGDGKWMGFAGAIALLIGVHLGFYFYASMSANVENRFQWESAQKYKPIEKYLTNTPGAVMLGKDRLWTSNNDKVRAISLENGKILEEKNFVTPVIRPGIQETQTPVFFGEKEIICYNRDLTVQQWKAPYPASFTNLEVADDKAGEVDYLPQTAFFTDSGEKLLVFYNYGYIGYYDLKSGENLWLQSVDRKVAINKYFSDYFPNQDYFHEADDRFVFSCQNGIVKAIEKASGNELWSYGHNNPKYNGKPQRAFLSGQQDRVLAAFKSGEMMTLALENGRVIYQARNEAFSFSSAPEFKGLEASFVTDEGFYYIAEIDGGRILYSCNLLPKKLNFLPVITALSKGIVAHKNEVFIIKDQQAKQILKISNRIFVTKPVFDDKLMYIGTQDGWIYCVHYGSFHQKLKIHVNGELEEGSLKISGSRLIVKTRSGSITSIDRRF